MNGTAPLDGARERLLRQLAVLAEDVAASAHARCPYRALDDLCTFSRRCRNRVPGPVGHARCAGGTLNSAPANAPGS